LLEKVAQRVDDKDIMHLLKLMLKASGKKGVPQGGVISPLLSNLYLNEVDKMLERAREVTRNGKYTNVEYARFADDLVVLIHAYSRHPFSRSETDAIDPKLSSWVFDPNGSGGWIPTFAWTRSATRSRRCRTFPPRNGDLRPTPNLRPRSAATTSTGRFAPPDKRGSALDHRQLSSCCLRRLEERYS
jgi:hypothetical protein